VVLRYIARARERGVGVVFITHNPHHAYPIGDRFVILRRGEVQGDFARQEIRLEDLAGMMAGGEDLERLAHELDRTGAVNGGAA
jgi:simple sugar transport system ATP-binding protein